MYYFLYIDKVFRIYIIIRYMHGTYISYHFLKWILTGIYSNFIWIISKLFKPYEQIDDIKYNIHEIDGFLIII